MARGDREELHEWIRSGDTAHTRTSMVSHIIHSEELLAANFDERVAALPLSATGTEAGPAVAGTSPHRASMHALQVSIPARTQGNLRRLLEGHFLSGSHQTRLRFGSKISKSGFVVSQRGTSGPECPGRAVEALPTARNHKPRLWKALALWQGMRSAVSYAAQVRSRG